MSMLSPSFKKFFGIAGLLVVFLSLAFYDIVFLGKTFKATTANSQALPYGAYGQAHNKPRFIPVNGTDAPVSEEPIYEFIKQNLHRGIVPLWNPHQACGYALIGMLEVGIFFPLNLILYLLPNIFAWDLLILARLFFAGLFTFWFMRRLGFKEAPSLTAAIVFMLSGPLVLLQYWTTNVDLLAPLLLLALDQLIKETNRRSIALTAAVAGMTLFAGHPEHVFLVNAFGAAFFVFRFLTLKPKAGFLKIFSSLVFSYILAAGLAAIVLFPFIRNWAAEFWHGHPAGTGLLMEEQRDRVLTLALPHFFQKENLSYDFTFAGWWGGYLGTLPLAFAFLSLFKKQAKGLNYFFAVMAVLIIGKEYGLPIINWLGYLPVFNMCRYAIHTPPLAALTIAILCGMGVQAVIDGRKLFTKGLIFTVGLSFIVAVHLYLLRSAHHLKISMEASLFCLALLIIFQLVLWLNDHKLIQAKILHLTVVMVIFAELFLYLHREHPRRFDSFGKVPYIEFLKSQPEAVRSYGIFWAFYPNTATGYEVDDLGYFLGLVPTRYVHFVNHLISDDHFKNDLRPPALRAVPIDGQRRFILDLLNVRYIITPDKDSLNGLLTNYGAIDKKIKPVYKNEVSIYERSSALPRAFIVHRVIFEENEQRTFEMLKRFGPSIREGAVINHPLVPKLADHVNSQPLHDESTVQMTSSTANEVILQADMKHAGFVVLSDAYHPDWQAYLDGKKWKVFQTNYLIRSVFVPEGEHEIKFVFAPGSFKYGAVISFCIFFVLLGLFFFPQRKSS